MANINPETLYNKTYSDVGDSCIDKDASKRFREFLQRAKPNFESVRGTLDIDVLESLEHNADKCDVVCKDIQNKLCSSVCNNIHAPYSVSSRSVVCGIIVSLTAVLVYKMRSRVWLDKQLVNVAEQADSDSCTNTTQSEEDIVDVPRIVHIKRGWFW